MITACNYMIRTYDYLVDEEDTGKFSAFFERRCDELGMGQVSILILSYRKKQFKIDPI